MIRRFICSISIALLCVSFLPHALFAATAESVQQQINDTNSQIRALDKEIQMYQSQISETNQKSNTLANLIKELNATRAKLTAEKNQTEKRITATGFVISSLRTTITSEEESIAKSKQALMSMIRGLRRNDKLTRFEMLLIENNFTNVTREYNNLVVLNEKVRDHIRETNKHKEILSESKNEKEVEQSKLSQLKENLLQKKLAVEITKKEKDTLLIETKNQESNYKILLAERIKKRDLFEKDLASYESQLKFILNPKLLPTEGSGILAWPLDTVYITQLFGRTQAAKRLYVSGSHSGVDLRASIGTAVKSMGNGTVIGTGDTDLYCKGASFGKWVFIKYDNGLSSTYGHLSLISSSAGQKVKTGDIVALSGNTGHSTGPHLHVTVYASQGADVKTVPSLSCNGKTFTMPIAPTSAYLDPMLYLPTTIPTMRKNDTPRD